jgi:hypothetical protein
MMQDIKGLFPGSGKIQGVVLVAQGAAQPFQYVRFIVDKKNLCVHTGPCFVVFSYLNQFLLLIASVLWLKKRHKDKLRFERIMRVWMKNKLQNNCKFEQMWLMCLYKRAIKGHGGGVIVKIGNMPENFIKSG